MLMKTTSRPCLGQVIREWLENLNFFFNHDLTVSSKLGQTLTINM